MSTIQIVTRLSAAQHAALQRAAEAPAPAGPMLAGFDGVGRFVYRRRGAAAVCSDTGATDPHRLARRLMGIAGTFAYYAVEEFR